MLKALIFTGGECVIGDTDDVSKNRIGGIDYIDVMVDDRKVTLPQNEAIILPPGGCENWHEMAKFLSKLLAETEMPEGAYKNWQYIVQLFTKLIIELRKTAAKIPDAADAPV